MKNNIIKILDCTLRDGGYYNNWNFSNELIHDYLLAMSALGVEFVEIGFRTLKNKGFKGGCAFSTDNYINSLSISVELKNKIGVMINGAELIPASKIMDDEFHLNDVLSSLFIAKKDSPVTLVRIACHIHEFEQCLPAANWLKKQGYLVGFNLMQIADLPKQEIIELAKYASNYPIDVLYFADSMGCLNPKQTSDIVFAFQQGWSGALGIHTHDSMGQAVTNSLEAMKKGVTWVDCTVTGMGRGPGNAQTEYLVLAQEQRNLAANPTKLLELIRKHFKPMQEQYGWGVNPYYYLAGKYGIHPSYIQEMLSDSRYTEEDILAVIEHLKVEGGKKFSMGRLLSARHFYSGDARGTWSPREEIEGKDVLILGTGGGVANHKNAIESYIRQHNPYVIALNTQRTIDENLISIRAACHPVRLLADCQEHIKLPQPLATPFSMLPKEVQVELKSKDILDFGIEIHPEEFTFFLTSSYIPTLLVISYALAIASSGKAKKIMLAGFDGYSADDPRSKEIDNLFHLYNKSSADIPLMSVTPTRYDIPTISIYALEGQL